MAHAKKVQHPEERVPVNPHEDGHEAAMDKALPTKSSQWSYECEWRLIRHNGGPGVDRFRPDDLTGIILKRRRVLRRLQPCGVGFASVPPDRKSVV